MKYTEDQIDAYLRGTMTSSEKAVFDAELEHDSALAREVDMMRLIVNGLTERQEKMETMAQWQYETDKKVAAIPAAREYREDASRRDTSRPWLPWVTAFSAAAALVLGVFLFHPVSSPTLSPDITSPGTIMRGGDYYEIDSLIEQKHYQEALEAIQSEMVETDRLLRESIRKRDEANYEVQKYEYALKVLHEKQDEIEALRDSD